VVSKSWTNEPSFSGEAAGRFEVEDLAKQIHVRTSSNPVSRTTLPLLPKAFCL
jgi:hypothetical protein